MVQETKVAIREPLAITPAEIVENATTQAKLLMDIVEKTGCFQNIAGKKYLQVEAWETIGAFNRTHAETESIEPILKDGEVIGYNAKVQLWKDGQVIGGAYMPCYFTENCCKGKEGDAKHKACMSAAQTFATSKAYRMNYAYVAILAGYQPLPAEEITEDMKQPKPNKKGHYCELHALNFFMKGKMKSYAHPIGDTGEWCHEHKEQPKVDITTNRIVEPKVQKTAVADEPEEKPESLPDAVTPENTGIGEEPSPIDLDWLKDQLGVLQGKGLKAWTNTNVLSYLNAVTGQKSGKISEAVKLLTKEQAEAFVAKVQEAVDLS